ncbi:MAG: glycerol-3-phosphate dehydrogenase subunit GlpB [Flavobacteriaceae bacterium]|jgi:glycerol-3-phosphate dehydrogenase subunit B|nr:glycerol-3-phosphate dehydrogenase subunit GlpB [Flavobacteriaceae bacterium]
MKFDTAIIGGGLSGLVAGIRLVRQNQKCVIISSGQSALHFFSGSFDLLNFLPDGSAAVKNPTKEIRNLIQQAPEHPYSKIGAEKFIDLAKKSEDFLTDINIKFQGSAKINHFRITPLGFFKPTWLTLSDFVVSENENKPSWNSVSIFNIEGFLDFQPEFVAESFNKMGIRTEIHDINLPELNRIRRNPSEFRSVNLTVVLDKPEIQNTLAQIFKEKSKNSEVIIFPACLGFESNEILPKLSEKIGKPVYLLPTLPPSLVGIRTQKHLQDYFKKSGGELMLGDNVMSGEFEDSRLTRIYTQNHGDIPIVADNFILAGGSFFSQGLIADIDHVYEPIFNLDVEFSPEREKWYNPNFFETQNYQKFGVKTDGDFKALKRNQPVENLYVSGAILSGFNPIKEGCGGGVSLLSALSVSEKILNIEETK